MAEGSATGRDEEAVRRFIERFALNLAEAGMPRMPARVFATVLVAENGRRTAAELAEHLGVSPPAISSSSRSRGAVWSHFASSARCWFPPDNAA